MNRTKGFSAVKVVVTLLVVVMMAAVAWAAMTLTFTGVGTVVLKNSAGTSVGTAVVSADVNPGTATIDLYYTDGKEVNSSNVTLPTSVVTDMEFPINISLVSDVTGVASIAWGPDVLTNGLIMSGGNATDYAFTANKAVDNTSTAKINISTYVAAGGIPQPSVNVLGLTSRLFTVGINKVNTTTWFSPTTASGGAGAGAVMFAGATYGLANAVKSLDVTMVVPAITAALIPVWDFPSMNISPKVSNGITATVIGPLLPSQATAILQFAGTPDKAVATTFTLTSNVKINNVVLKNVKKDIVITPVVNPMTVVPQGLTFVSMTDPSPTILEDTITVQLASGYTWDASGPTLYVGNMNLGFAAGVDSVPWSGMTITRTKVTSDRYQFRFSGRNVNDNSLTSFKVLATLAHANGPYAILSGPFTVTVGSPTPVTLNLNPTSTGFVTNETWAGTTFSTATMTGATLSSIAISGVTKDGKTMADSEWSKYFTVSGVSSGTATVRSVGTTNPETGSYVISLSATGGNGVVRTNILPVTITAPSAPKLSASKNVSGTSGKIWDDSPVTITASPSGTISGLEVSPTSWNGLTFTASGSSVAISGTPVNTGSSTVTTPVTVNGKVGTATATPATFTVSIAPSATPTVSVSPTSLTYANGSYTGQTLSITTNNSTATPVVTAANSAYLTVDTVSGSGSNYTVSVRPNSGFSYGTSDVNTSVTVALSGATSRTVSVVLRGSGTPGSTLFVGSSQWSKIRNDTNKTYDLYIPVTSTFVNLFDRNNNGQVTTDEISSILASVTAPYADLLSSSTWFEMINNDSSSYGTLHLRLFFDPHSGHNLDWYVNLVLQALQVLGANGADYSQIFGSGVTIESIRNYYSGGGSGGCTAGFAPFALLLLAPLALRRKD